MRKGIVALGGMIVGLVFLFVSFLGPWYMINATGIFGSDYSVGLYLTRMELQGKIGGGQDVSVSMGYEEAKTSAFNTYVNVESFGMIEAAMYLMILAMATTVIAAVFIAAFVFTKGKTLTMKLGGAAFGALTCLLTFLTAVLFMSTDFVENSDGFWFSFSAFGMTLSGGPGYAWYLTIVVALVALVSAAAILLVKTPGKAVLTENVPSTPTK